jgi:hypothetical protein
VNTLEHDVSSLIFNCAKEEIASNFKEQGNDCFKQKRYRDALGFYNQALEAKPTDNNLKESLLLNRAACNLELSGSRHFSNIHFEFLSDPNR